MTILRKKVVLLGDSAVGKTSMVRRFVEDKFDDKYITTIGVKVSKRVAKVWVNEDFVEIVMMI